MKFIFSRATSHKTKEIELNTLQELIDLVKEEKEAIIINCTKDMEEPYELIVYNTYMES